jgi:hypothetical protein
VWIFRYRLAVLFDPLLYYAVRHREHPIYKVGEAFVFDVTLCDLGGWLRVCHLSARAHKCARMRSSLQLEKNFRYGPYRLRSLYEMYEVDAELLVRLGESFVTLDKMFEGGLFNQRPIGNPQILWLRDNLPVMASHCQTLQLPTAEGLIRNFVRDYERINPSWKETQIRMACIKETFKTELSNRLCLFVHAYKSQFYLSPLDHITGDDLIIEGSFHSVIYDLLNAGRCYAFEQNTASVFHSMRVLEKGLHALAIKIGVPEAPSLEQWHNVIEQIESKIKDLHDLKKSVYKSETLKQYSDAALEFRYFKEAWRNHAVHSREKYTDTDALRVLTHVRLFMLSLVQSGVQESTGPVTAPSA